MFGFTESSNSLDPPAGGQNLGDDRVELVRLGPEQRGDGEAEPALLALVSGQDQDERRRQGDAR